MQPDAHTSVMSLTCVPVALTASVSSLYVLYQCCPGDRRLGFMNKENWASVSPVEGSVKLLPTTGPYSVQLAGPPPPLRPDPLGKGDPHTPLWPPTCYPGTCWLRLWSPRRYGCRGPSHSRGPGPGCSRSRSGSGSSWTVIAG